MLWLNLWALLMPILLMIIAWSLWLISRTAKIRAEQESGQWGRVIRTSSATADFLALVRRNPRNIVLAVSTSAVTTGLLVGAIVMVSTIAAIPNLSGWEVARAATLSMFANGVPISPGGIGVGEAAFNQICVWIAHSDEHYPYATIFLAYRVISLVVACYGAIGLMNVRRLTSPDHT